MMKLSFPYHYQTPFNLWEKSYLYDIDGEGRKLFSDLTTTGAYHDGKLVGFIQYGRTAFGFDANKEISDTVSYSVIRHFFYDEEQEDSGLQLLNTAIKDLSNPPSRIYAFFTILVCLITHDTANFSRNLDIFIIY